MEKRKKTKILSAQQGMLSVTKRPFCQAHLPLTFLTDTQANHITTVAKNTSTIIYFILFQICVQQCFACIYVCMRVPDTLNLELQRVVKLPCGFWKLHTGPLEEQPDLLTVEPSVQPQHLDFINMEKILLSIVSY